MLDGDPAFPVWGREYISNGLTNCQELKFGTVTHIDPVDFPPLKISEFQQEGQHPLTGKRAANFRLLANQ